MGVSGNLWIVVKDVKTLVLYDVEFGMPLEPVQGNAFHLELIWGTSSIFHSRGDIHVLLVL